MSNLDISISVSWQGRLRRKVFWCTFLILEGIQLVFSMMSVEEEFASVLSLLILPFELSLIVRRAQDAGLKDELKYFLVGADIILTVLDLLSGEDEIVVGVLSLAFLVTLIVLMSKDSIPGVNQWGPNPKEENAGRAQTNSGGSPKRCAARHSATPGRAQVNSGGTPKRVCPTCSGSGKNAAGCTCPRCGGKGSAS